MYSEIVAAFLWQIVYKFSPTLVTINYILFKIINVDIINTI